ncbi:MULTISPECIES: hypothetical protein [Streptomyces]|uniref:hypothetical protein n=1 Tax=Streptomyces TaxID=1883 RepID=UPI000F553043|nr:MULTISPECIES: hypothetical protein [Streptomyces]NEE59850.1 hypothetical protein [Streptomyces sp. SID8455]
MGDAERFEEPAAGGPVGFQGADAAERDAAGPLEGSGVAAQVLPYVVVVEPRRAAGDFHELRVRRPVAEQ